MKKILLFIFIFFTTCIFSSFAKEKNASICNNKDKIKESFYISKINGEILVKKYKPGRRLKNSKDKIVIIWNFGEGNAEKYDGMCPEQINIFSDLAGVKIGNKETIFFHNGELRKSSGGGHFDCNFEWFQKTQIIDQQINVGKKPSAEEMLIDRANLMKLTGEEYNNAFDDKYWSCINVRHSVSMVEERYKKMRGILKRFIKSGVPANQIFVSGISAGGVDAVRSSGEYSGTLMNAGIAIYPFNWDHHPGGGRRTVYINQVKSFKKLNILMINGNSNGSPARFMRSEYMQWMKIIPGVEWIETPSINQNNKIITPDGKECKIKKKWGTKSIEWFAKSGNRTYNFDDFENKKSNLTYNQEEYEKVKNWPDGHEMINHQCFRYYWPQVIDYITRRLEIMQ
jgi:hypothetical protein